MDEDMWRHPATQANLQKIQDFGNKVVPVEKGELASGLFGDGRMAEPEKILEHLMNILSPEVGDASVKADISAKGSPSPLRGKRALVTAGPTYEAIDPVRFIGNHSSGKMGIAIANELAARGASVRLVLGPSSQHPEIPGVVVERVVSAAEMFEVCMSAFAGTDIAILSAAVADYTPTATAAEKIKKTGDYLNLELARTKDILKTLGAQKKQGQLLVGFALETSGGRDYALGKLTSKNADLIVLNSLSDEGAGFGLDTNKITIFGKDGFEKAYEKKPKQQVAQDIVDTIINRLYA
jgi:phosphopantothenoylcysteine decarboxylase/phosphopantothenate--cysteine ligase